MVVDLFYSCDVLCANDGSLPRTLVSYEAAEMDDAVANDHVKTLRAPVVLRKRIDDTPLDVIIVGSRVGNFASETRHSLQ